MRRSSSPTYDPASVRLRDSWRERRETALLVRYEDLILRPEPELARMCSYLGVTDDEPVIGATLARAATSDLEGQERYATARDPRASIGRWRTDLSEALQEACQAGSAMCSSSSAMVTDVIASPDGALQAYEGRIDAARSLATTVLPAGARVVSLYPGFEEALAGDGREVSNFSYASLDGGPASIEAQRVAGYHCAA